MSTITKDLGAVTAYAYAVEKGYTGTETEFAGLMASYATVAEEAAESAESASQSAESASASAQTATSKASEASISATQAGASATSASQSASTATTKASEASASASTASTKANEASQSATTASSKASEASASATSAQTAQTAAEGSATTAQTAAQTATTKAAEAAESARTLTIDPTLSQSGRAADAKVVGDEIEGVKSDLSDVFTKSVYEKDNSSPAKIFECMIVANTTYYIKNIGSVSVNVRTCTSDGTEVEIVKNDITVGEIVTFTATQNASYIRLYAVNGNSAVSVRTNGEILKIEDAKIAESNNRITESNNRITYIDKATGLEWYVGYFISSGNGGVSSATDRACTGYIPCAEDVSITYVGENNHASVYGISFFDKYFKVISGDSNSGTLGDVTTVTSPAGTAYVRLSTKTSILEDSYFAINDIRKTTLVNISDRLNDAPVYVDGVNGDDSTGNGSLTARYKSIGKAISAGATKIGIFPNSTYTETISLDGKDIHLFSYIDSASEYNGTTNPTRPKAIISGGGTVSTALTIQNARNVVLEDIIVTGCTYDGCKINKCQNVTIIGCEFNSNGNNGIVFNNSNGVFRDCIAHDNDHDGFNLNYFGDSQFFNCSGYDNGDDGISHHQGTTGLIDGGEWYGNAKGGVSSPCYGAKVDIRNVYSHDNKFGIYAFASDSSESRPFHIWNSVITDNSEYGVAVKYNVPYLYGNKISGNTTGQTTGYGTTTFHTLD